MVKTAVILAAGMGSRLGEHANNRPKGFIQLNGLRLIDASIRALMQAGIEKIVIGTGYQAEAYEEMAADKPHIQCVRNPDFATTGSMETLYRLREQIPADFLLLESDLLYDPAGIVALQEQAQDNVLLASGPTQSSDEVFVAIDREGHLLGLSKHRAQLVSVDAELVGITKVSADFLRLMCDIHRTLANPLAEYESLIVAASKQKPMRVMVIADFVWCEIDDIQHLARAQREILPKLQSRGLS